MSEVAQATPEAVAPAGWYPVDGAQRYWDGSAWTPHTAPAVTPPGEEKKSGDLSVPIWALIAGVFAVYLAEANRFDPQMLLTGGYFLRDGWANALEIGGIALILLGGYAAYSRRAGGNHRPWIVAAGLLTVGMTLFDLITLLIVSVHPT